MAVKKFFLSFGQSNANALASSIPWEDINPGLRLRSPAVPLSLATQYAQGAYNDDFTMPGTFKGGPQFGQLGESTAGQWQVINCRGVAVQAIRYLQFYNPIASFWNQSVQWTTTYPHTLILNTWAPGTRTVINVSHIFQADPTGVVLTRQRTGTAHTVTSGGTLPTSQLTVTPPLDPPPVGGEQFSYSIKASATGTTTTLKLKSRFGGFSDAGDTTAYLIDAFDTATGKFQCKRSPMFVGRPVTFAASTSPLPSGITPGDVYFIAKLEPEDELDDDSYTEFYISDTAGGEILSGASLDSGTAFLEANVTVANPGVIDFTAPHAFLTGSAIRFTVSGSDVLPAPLQAGVTYYAANVAANTIEVSLTAGGASIEFTDNGTGGGNVHHAAGIAIKREPLFRGSLTGMQARCVAATDPNNVGEARALKDIVFDSGTSLATVTCDAFPGATEADDEFVFEPPPDVNGDEVPFKKWGYFLPWCPFEGKAEGTQQSLLPFSVVAWTVTMGSTLLGQTAGFLYWLGMPCKFYYGAAGSPAPALPGPLVYGKTYYIVDIDENGRFSLSETYGGDPIVATDSVNPVASTLLHQADQQGKLNPFPPGFNFPSHYAVPTIYQPYEGSISIPVNPRISYTVPLASLFHEAIGDNIYVVDVAFGGSTLAHKEIPPPDQGVGHSWWDPNQHISWSPAEDNGCYGRLVDTIDAAIVAAAAEGHTLECLGCFFIQGETDADTETFADRYEDNLRTFKTKVRNLLVNRGLASVAAEDIPWIQPLIDTEPYVYATTVRTAIQTVADDDPNMRTFECSDLTKFDAFHYDSLSIQTLAERCYEAWKALQRTGTSEVDICNLALANIGETAAVTSIRPPDGSTQATLCAMFYPRARDAMLERHTWDFTTRWKALTATTNVRTEWTNAYLYPSDATGIISILPTGASGDQRFNGEKVAYDYTVELDINGDRIIYTNLADACVRYTAKVTDPTKFSERFVQACAWELASRLAGPIIKGEEGAKAVEMALRMAEIYGRRAAQHDSNRKRETSRDHRPSWINKRNGG